ncbi:hypothetical protein [Streptomyces sp. NPDC002671]
MTGPDGVVRLGLEAVVDALAAASDPGAVLRWLRPHTKAAAVLARLGADGCPVEHVTLDQYGANRAVRYLRGVLVTAGALPQRDERMVALEQSLEEIIESLADTDDQKLVRAYARWDRVARLRRRLRGHQATQSQTDGVRMQVKEAARLLQWLREQGASLSQSSQHDIDL